MEIFRHQRIPLTKGQIFGTVIFCLKKGVKQTIALLMIWDETELMLRYWSGIHIQNKLNLIPWQQCILNLRRIFHNGRINHIHNLIFFRPGKCAIPISKFPVDYRRTIPGNISITLSDCPTNYTIASETISLRYMFPLNVCVQWTQMTGLSSACVFHLLISPYIW